MISNIVVSLFGAAYNWPLGAAISLCMLLLVVTCCLPPSASKKSSLVMTGGIQSGRAPLLTVYAALIYAFLYFPIIVLVVYSFNGSGVGGFPPSRLDVRLVSPAFSGRRAVGCCP